jgi:hypothetical protein
LVVAPGDLIVTAEGESEIAVYDRSRIQYIPIAEQPSAPNDNLTKTQLLIGGVWTFDYSISGIAFDDKYAFTTTSGPDSTGLYYAYGSGQQGEGDVIGGYDASSVPEDLPR